MNRYEIEKWGVRILGPDNIFAAHSFEEAIAMCADINANIAKYAKPRCTTEMHPLVFAQVDVWSGLTPDRHDPDNTNWTDLY